MIDATEPEWRVIDCSTVRKDHTEFFEEAEQLVRDYGSDPKGMLVGAIAAALYCQRLSATERAAKIAEDRAQKGLDQINEVYWQGSSSSAEIIAAAIRSQP